MKTQRVKEVRLMEAFISGVGPLLRSTRNLPPKSKFMRLLLQSLFLAHPSRVCFFCKQLLAKKLLIRYNVGINVKENFYETILFCAISIT